MKTGELIVMAHRSFVERAASGPEAPVPAEEPADSPSDAL